MKGIHIRSTAVALLGTALVACGDGGTGPVPVSPDEVADIYRICTLRFEPSGSQPPVDIREEVFELENPDVGSPQLRMNPTQEMQLVYTNRGEFVERSMTGTFTIRGDRVRLRITAGTVAPSAILLPPELELTYRANPKALVAEPSDIYEVRRQDYTRVSGVSESGLAETIPGRLTAAFRKGTCS